MKDPVLRGHNLVIPKCSRSKCPGQLSIKAWHCEQNAGKHF